MKKYIKIGLSILAVVVLFFAYFGTTKVSALNSLDINSTNTNNPFSTTTQRYMTAGTATTTLTLDTRDTDQINLNVIYNASTTGAQLRWRYEFSADTINWFAQDTELSNNATTTDHVGSFAEHNWVYASSTAGTSVSTGNFKHIKLKDIASPYTRVVFYVPVGSSPAQIWVQSIKKNYSAI